jgi:hypothetical protein
MSGQSEQAQGKGVGNNIQRRIQIDEDNESQEDNETSGEDDAISLTVSEGSPKPPQVGIYPVLKFLHKGKECAIMNPTEIQSLTTLVDILSEGLNLGLPVADAEHFNLYYKLKHGEDTVTLAPSKLRKLAKTRSTLKVKDIGESRPWTTQEKTQWKLSFASYILLVLGIYGFIWKQDLSLTAITSVLVVANRDTLWQFFSRKFVPKRDLFRLLALLAHIGIPIIIACIPFWLANSPVAIDVKVTVNNSTITATSSYPQQVFPKASDCKLITFLVLSIVLIFIERFFLCIQDENRLKKAISKPRIREVVVNE